MLYGAVHNGTYYAMKTSYDEEFSGLSPGVRLFHEAIRHPFWRGACIFRFSVASGRPGGTVGRTDGLSTSTSGCILTR
ncbi:MAG: GNAT family N-acetyltransferase [Candidatus Eisenbacteria sp.]|nr:GNAT family N-acetyltransferase [Candidatus Eisenbacteria bacterium]